MNEPDKTWLFEWDELVTYQRLIAADSEEEAKAEFLALLATLEPKTMVGRVSGDRILFIRPDNTIDDTWEPDKES